MANVPGAENAEATEAADPFADMEFNPDELAYNGKIINVRLSDGSIEREDIPEQMYKDYLGGYGIGARLLFDRIPAGADPLGPANVLGMLPGLLTGTPIFGNRFQVVCKSPSTGGWGDANCGGDFGPYLKFAGWDGILLYGQADSPVYILIDGDDVSIEDASEYWGMGAIEVENAFKEKYGKKASVASIGPSGEQLSYLSGICNEHGRLAARSGVGAVMGSKKVKAVVVKGVPRENMLSQDTTIRALAKKSRDEFIAPLRDFFATFGTTGITAGSAHNGDSPVRNWGGVGVDVFPNVDPIQGPVVNATRMTHNYDELQMTDQGPVAMRKTSSGELRPQVGQELRLLALPDGLWRRVDRVSLRGSGARPGRNRPRERRLQVSDQHAPRRVRDDGLVWHDEPEREPGHAAGRQPLVQRVRPRHDRRRHDDLVCD